MSKKHKKHFTPKRQKNLLDFSLDYIHQRITNDLPYMYSAVALATWELIEGDEEQKYDAVMEMINKSVEIWNEVVNSGKDIIEECERITGIQIIDHVC